MITRLNQKAMRRIAIVLLSVLIALLIAEAAEKGVSFARVFAIALLSLGLALQIWGEWMERRGPAS